EGRGRRKSPLPWQSRVLSFSELYDEVRGERGREFETAFKEKLSALKEETDSGAVTLMEACFSMVEFCLSNLSDNRPLMVIGISPPYYPHVCNDKVEDLSPDIRDLASWVNRYSMEEWKMPYAAKKYFTGISDMSYAYPPGDREEFETVVRNMPLWGPVYTIPFDAMSRIHMPCVNIGPWGKDLHKLTERVNKTDLYKRTPRILYRLVRRLLNMAG
ncbi:MAG: hypothetical protein MI741_22150, partial [Rhodospirillales bacterium]|nr:hypothetical protein [Rhodospirillales bacterium]